jgi:hypothetical protein
MARLTRWLERGYKWSAGCPCLGWVWRGHCRCELRPWSWASHVQRWLAADRSRVLTAHFAHFNTALEVTVLRDTTATGLACEVERDASWLAGRTLVIITRPRLAGRPG